MSYSTSHSSASKHESYGYCYSAFAIYAHISAKPHKSRARSYTVYCTLEAYLDQFAMVGTCSLALFLCS